MQNFRKTNISDPLIRTCACVYQSVRNVSFSENFAYVLKWMILNEHDNEYFSETLNLNIQEISFKVRICWIPWAAFEAILSYSFQCNMKSILTLGRPMWKLLPCGHHSLVISKKKSVDQLPYDWQTRFHKFPSYGLMRVHKH